MGQQDRIGNRATTVSRSPDGTIRVTYHETDVVTVYPNGRIDLDTGGWRTPTTKTRMNQASHQLGLGFLVWQKDWEWYVDIDGQTLLYPFTQSRLTIRLGSDFPAREGQPPIAITRG